MWTTRAFFTAAYIASASFTVMASGFSQRTCLPAFAAAMAISAWVSLAVLMSMMSISGSFTTLRQSVAVFFQPSCFAAAFTPLGSRPQTVCMTGSKGTGKKWPTWRHAFEWVLPMNL